jgi:hypothetical protein
MDVRYIFIKNNHRHAGASFLKAWIVSLILMGGIIYPILVVGTLNYSGKDPSLGNMDLYYRKKDAIAESLGTKPRLFIIGGSSAFYGIDALLIEKKLNIPVVNYGMQAGLGLEYQLKRLLRLLKTNDSVLFAFESSQYATATNQFTDVLHHYVFSYDQAYLLDIGFKRAIQKFYGIPLRDFLDSWKIWKQTVKRKNPFSGRLKGNDWVMTVDKRGGRHAADTWTRPLTEMVLAPELKPYAEEVIKNFIKEAQKRNVKVYFTWPTTVRRGNLLSEDAKKGGQKLSVFLQTQGIVVIDNYADHLYPFSFYTDTPYHLSRAGTHIRTEKLIESLRPYFGQNSEPQKTTRFFLLDERHHQIEYFKYDGDDRYDFKVYVNQSDSDYMLDDSGIQRALKHGQQVYFSDERLKPLLQEKFRIETASCKERSLETDINQYNNHIFFMILNHVDEVASLNKDVLPKHFYDALIGKGYRIMVLGTGKYSDINIVKRDEKLCEMTLNRKKSIGNIWLPFDLQMVSTKKPLSRFNIDQIAFFERDIYKPGLWMLVYDPDLGIIVDQFIYPDMAPHQSACLYRMRR